MTFDLANLMRAARLCRERSTEGRVIYLLVTEQGFIVRGDRGALTTAHDVSWPELDANPGQLENAIQLVALRLRA